MINISSITLFPKLYKIFFETSIIKNAISHNLINHNIVNIIDSVEPKKHIDSPIVGGSAGMLLGTTILEKNFDRALKNHLHSPLIIFFSPQGKLLNQLLLEKIYNDLINNYKGNMITFAARYEGYDIRAEEFYAHYTISCGDFVSMGGDIPALLFYESLLRLVPGIVGKKESVLNDSFQKNLLDCDHFANPDIWKNKEIPSLLKSGNHEKIAQWRENNQFKKTIIKRFDWWRKCFLSIKEKNKAKEYIPSHYVALLHNDVMMPNGTAGESSVTSIDIHDISRSSATYGIKGYFIITRLSAQREIVKKFLHFWHEGEGVEYNKNRSFALSRTHCLAELEDAINFIKDKEKKEPIIIVTSSRREIKHHNMITFHDQEKIWSLQRPVLFVLGTSHGIAPNIMNQCEYRLIPIEGLEEFNFLSVRSAAAIIFDRWLGLSYKKE